VSQIIHIPRNDAPKVIARFGTMANLVTQVLEPTIGNYFRNAVSIRISPIAQPYPSLSISLRFGHPIIAPAVENAEKTAAFPMHYGTK
jgi:uncharacterized membrane protein YqiK